MIIERENTRIDTGVELESLLRPAEYGYKGYSSSWYGTGVAAGSQNARITIFHLWMRKLWLLSSRGHYAHTLLPAYFPQRLQWVTSPYI